LHVTLSTLLEGRYPAAMIDQRDNDPVTYPTPTSVYVAFGVDDKLADVPPDLDFETSDYTFEDETRNRLSIKHYAYEPKFAPPGKNVLIAFFDADYYWWNDLAEDEQAYEAEKKRLADELQQAIVTRFPRLQGKMQTLDVATPLTYEHYCSAWRGAWMAYAQTPNAKRLFLRGQIKRIKNLYMAGQWLMPPGGLPVAVVTGRWAIQRICKAEKMPWRW
jgi:phytoene dehydrogenase-like protein